jgi:hypothetical protein
MGPDIIADVARVIAASEVPVDKLSAYFGVTRQTIYNWRNQTVRSIDRRQLARILDPDLALKLKVFVNGETADGENTVAEIIPPEPGRVTSIPPDRTLRRNEPPYADLLREHFINPNRLDVFKRRREEQKRHVHQGQLADHFRNFEAVANTIVSLPNSVDEVGWLLFSKGLAEERCIMAMSNTLAPGRPLPADDVATMLLVERARYLGQPYVQPVFRDQDRLETCGVFMPLAGGNILYLVSAHRRIESEVKTVLVERETFRLTNIVTSYLDEIGGKSSI